MYKCINLWRIHGWLKSGCTIISVHRDNSKYTHNFSPEWASGKAMGKKATFWHYIRYILNFRPHKNLAISTLERNQITISIQIPDTDFTRCNKEPATALHPGATYWQLRAVVARTHCPPGPIVLATLLQAAASAAPCRRPWDPALQNLTKARVPNILRVN